MVGIVILGAGECGVRAAFAAREQGYDGPITLVGAEAGLPYERPPLSKPVEDGVTRKPFCAAQALADERIRYLDEVAALRIDRQARTVALSSSEKLSYDTLLLATGASPRRLSCDGGDKALTFRTLQDAEKIYSAAEAAEQTVIIGAGLIGLELAAALRVRGKAVVVLEFAPFPLARNVPKTLARRIVDRHLAEGVRLQCNAQVSRITDTEVVLADGTAIKADLVVAAVGVTPNVDLAQTCGLSVENGICVNAQLRTNDPNIYAAGDCASVACDGIGHQRFETWQNAQTQGEIAGRNMVGGALSFQPPVWFWSEQFDLGLQGVGTTLGEASALRNLGDGAQVLFYLDAAGRLKGAAGLGHGNAVAKDIKLAQKLIEAGVTTAPESLADTTTNLKKLLRPAAAA